MSLAASKTRSSTSAITPRRVAAWLLALSWLAACAQKVVFETNTRDDGGTVTGVGGAGGSSGGAGACASGQSAFLDFHPELSNVIVALDRSTSMNGPFGSSTKLETARDLLTKLVGRYEHSVRFGYVGFPGPGCFPDGCCDHDASDPIQHGYQSFVTNLRRCDVPNTCAVSSERPTAAALAASLDGFTSPNPPGFDRVVLITDGPPGCTNNNDVCRDALDWAQELNLRSIRVFVIDLDSSAQDRCLGNLAATANGFYENVSAGQFEDRLDDLLGSIARDACRLDIETPAVDPNNVSVLYNDQIIPRGRDHVNGWDFNSSFRIITIYGNACEMIVRGGDPDRIDVIEDCRPTR